jgi:hypothetical protein
MTSQNPGNPPRTSTDPARRAEWGLDVTDPPPKSTNPGLRAWAGIGALLAVTFIVAAAIALWNYGTHTSPTATGPTTTQSAPSSTGQGGAANTGAAR